MLHQTTYGAKTKHRKQLDKKQRDDFLIQLCHHTPQTHEVTPLGKIPLHAKFFLVSK
jgi:hypothetical protein